MAKASPSPPAAALSTTGNLGPIIATVGAKCPTCLPRMDRYPRANNLHGHDQNCQTSRIDGPGDVDRFATHL
jgi:hypothetical protein